MLFQSSGKHYTPELQEEKRKDYRNVVMAQAGLLLISLLTDDWLHHEMLSFCLFQVCAVVYLALLWDLSRNFTFVRWVPRALGWLAVGVTTVSLLFNLVFYSEALGPWLNGTLHAITVAIQWTVIGLGLRDLIRGPRTAADKLWAAAGLYLMIGIVFGEMIHVLHLFSPGTLGPGIPPSVKGFHEALYLSFAILTGADNELDGISHLCRNLTVVESLVSQLYMVMLISRLLISEGDSDDGGAVSAGGPAVVAGPSADAEGSGAAAGAGSAGGLQSAPGGSP